MFWPIALVMIGLSLALWVLAADRMVQGRPVLQAEARRPVPWNLVDLILMLLLGISAMVMSTWLTTTWFDLPAAGDWRLRDLQPKQQMRMLVSFSVTTLIALTLTLLVVRLRAKAVWRDLGWDAGKVWSDVQLGMAGFFMLMAPMLIVHFVAQKVFPTEEMHPFIEVIIDDPRFAYLVPIAFAAVVVAPLSEEIFFRVLLQGWMERVAVEWHNSAHLVGQEDVSQGVTSESKDAVDVSYTATVDRERGQVVGPVGPGASQESFGVVDESTSGMPVTRWGRLMPILVSSFLFAMAHVGQGSAPIALFLLALGLGYLYQRTHRLVPCLVVHFLVNLTAIVQLVIEVARHRS